MGINLFSNLCYEYQMSGVGNGRLNTVKSQSIKIDNEHYQVAHFQLIILFGFI